MLNDSLRAMIPLPHLLKCKKEITVEMGPKIPLVISILVIVSN
jgi:hypothetical protein